MIWIVVLLSYASEIKSCRSTTHLMPAKNTDPILKMRAESTNNDFRSPTLPMSPSMTKGNIVPPRL